MKQSTLARIKDKGTSSDKWERERNGYRDITQPEKIQQQQFISLDFEEPLADHTETSMVKIIPDMNKGGSVANRGEDSRSVESCVTLGDMLSTVMTRGTGNMDQVSLTGKPSSSVETQEQGRKGNKGNSASMMGMDFTNNLGNIVQKTL